MLFFVSKQNVDPHNMQINTRANDGKQRETST